MKPQRLIQSPNVNLHGLLVMLSCYFKVPQKDVGVPQVAVRSSFCRAIAKLFSYQQTLEKKQKMNACLH